MMIKINNEDMVEVVVEVVNKPLTAILNKIDNIHKNNIIVTTYNFNDSAELLIELRYYFYNRRLRLMDTNSGWEWAEKYHNLIYLDAHIERGCREFQIGFEIVDKDDDNYTYILSIMDDYDIL